MEFHVTFSGKWEIPWNSMDLGSMNKIPWNSMERCIWTKFHGLPWDLGSCCASSMELHGTTGVVQMLFKSSKELWRKFHWTFWSKYVSALSRNDAKSMEEETNNRHLKYNFTDEVKMAPQCYQQMRGLLAIAIASPNQEAHCSWFTVR